jgi:hypothetical protein
VSSAVGAWSLWGRQTLAKAAVSLGKVALWILSGVIVITWAKDERRVSECFQAPFPSETHAQPLNRTGVGPIGVFWFFEVVGAPDRDWSLSLIQLTCSLTIGVGRDALVFRQVRALTSLIGSYEMWLER